MVNYEVDPQTAYFRAGSRRGRLIDVPTPHRKCGSCRKPLKAYSDAGVRETPISGLCEPCFDFISLHPDDREPADGWMMGVKIKIED